MTGYEATAAVDVAAPAQAVWQMLTTRASEVWLGSEVTSGWSPGDAITWSGEWEGESFEDHGEVVAADEPRRLEFTHTSHGSDAADAHRISVTLTPDGDGTHVELVQDNNPSEESAEHSSANMQQVLDAVKQGAEAGTAS